MEIRDWAIQILSAETLDGKLLNPEILTDLQPGPPIFWKEPCRPAGMNFSRHSREEKLPSFQEQSHADKRSVCLHRFAGHELLAVEIMAFTLLAFPDAPCSFRKGLAHTLKEEQGHVKLYIDRLNQLGVKFGDMPLYRHFWSHTPYITSPLHYISLMSLTFEMANLDFAPMYGKSFLQHGDTESAQLMATILNDELSHVRFGWQWLKKMKPSTHSEWDAWKETIATTRSTPKRAIGFNMNETNRIKAGIPQDWIDNLKTFVHPSKTSLQLPFKDLEATI